MTLRINGENVDFALEKEAVLSEVVAGVKAWLAESGYLLTGIAYGDKDLLSTPREKWASVPVSSVAELDFSASRPQDVKIEHWATSRAWLNAVAQAVSARSIAALEELTAGLPSTIEGLRKNPCLPAGSDSLDRLASLFAGQTPKTIGAWPAEKAKKAGESISVICEALTRRIDAAVHPSDALRKCLAELKPMTGSVSEVSLLLQTGKDAQAMNVIVRFSEIVQNLLDIIPFLPKDEERDALFREINPFLRQLIEAFDSRDLVLIGDLFEYEVAPRLTRLLPALERCI
jgi:hypothetical protein